MVKTCLESQQFSTYVFPGVQHTPYLAQNGADLAQRRLNKAKNREPVKVLNICPRSSHIYVIVGKHALALRSQASPATGPYPDSRNANLDLKENYAEKQLKRWCDSAHFCCDGDNKDRKCDDADARWRRMLMTMKREIWRCGCWCSSERNDDIIDDDRGWFWWCVNSETSLNRSQVTKAGWRKGNSAVVVAIFH